MVTQLVSSSSTDRPTPSAISAVTIGTTIANTDPNTSSSTTTAASSPYASLPDGPCSVCIAGPPYSTCTPRSATGSKASWARVTASSGMSLARSVNCTVAIPV